jgi:quinol monooxygenase YgiN
MKTILSFSILIALFISFGCKTGNNAPVKKAADSAIVKITTDSLKMITAKIFVKKENINDFIKAAKGMIENTAKEPGCVSYMLYQNPFEPTHLIFFETYKNQAAIDSHFASSYFKEFGPVIKDWLSQPSEIKIYGISSVK